MKYDFITEFVKLWQTPKTAEDAKNKLCCLKECAEKNGIITTWENQWHSSKRYFRLLRMYHAFKTGKVVKL